MADSHLTPIEKRLVEMQEKLVEVLHVKLDNGEMTAAEMTVCLNLLKANGIDCGTGKMKGSLESLASKLPFRDPEISEAAEG